MPRPQPINSKVGEFDLYSLHNAKCSKLNCLFVCISLRWSNISDCQADTKHNTSCIFQGLDGEALNVPASIVLLVTPHQEATWNLFLKDRVVL